MITGCFEGGAYLLAGREGGGFAKPTPILDRDGDPLRLGQYWDYEAKEWTGMKKSRFKDLLGLSATPVDWDDDGDLDLLLGGFKGRVFLRMNEGTPKKPIFASESIPVDADGDYLEVSGRHAMPVVADWDGDGLWDLISGSANGDVHWWRNIGRRGAPEFGAAAMLVPASKTVAGEINPGKRSQVHATDFDGDGDLDLLVGDYHSEGKQRHGWVWLYRRTGRGAGPPGE